MKGDIMRGTTRRQDRDLFLRGLGLNYTLFLLIILPILAPVLAIGADRIATNTVTYVRGAGHLAGNLTIPCAMEDGSGTRLPCFWDARTMGNRDPGVLTAVFGLTGYVLYPGEVDSNGDAVACNETTDDTFICEDGFEWSK